ERVDVIGSEPERSTRRQLLRLPFVRDADDRAGDRGAREDPRDCDLRGRDVVARSDSCQLATQRGEVELCERMAATETVPVERVEIEAVREEAARERRPRKHAESVRLR